MSLDDITYRIGHWLASNDLPRDGVKIILEFPDKEAACRAEMTIKREIEPTLAHYVTGGTFGEIEKMNGLGLSLRVTPERRKEGKTMSQSGADDMRDVFNPKPGWLRRDVIGAAVSVAWDKLRTKKREMAEAQAAFEKAEAEWREAGIELDRLTEEGPDRGGQ